MDDSKMKEEIIEAINEWPVDGDMSEYNDIVTDRVHNPTSVASFFLRNVGKKDKGKTDEIKKEVEQEEVSADVALAKWWKQNKHRLGLDSFLPKTNNPHTIINFVARTEEGLAFIQDEIRRLRDKMSEGNRSVSILSALSSFYEKQGNLSLAKLHLETVIHKNPNDKESRWRLLRQERALRYRRAQEDALKNMDHNSVSTITALPNPTEVDRVAASDLSFRDFFHNYALTSTPVIITGLADKITAVPWTLEHIQQMAGDCKVTLRKSVKDSVQWARLEDGKTTTVGEFITGIHDNEAEYRDMYLFDWSLPLHCPKLAGEITVPKYFAGDFLQRTSPGSLYQDSWPSLFIAPADLCSELHVDAFSSNFWMAMFQGKKKWTFFSRDDVALLYPEFSQPWSSDPIFQADLHSPDLSQHPLLAATSPRQCTLQSGEILFVPAGCPHMVENLETSLAISGNFVDLSNLHLVQEQLTLDSLLDERSCDLLKQLNDPDFPTSMDSDIDHVPWDKYKSWTKGNESETDLTLDSVQKFRDKDL